MKKDFLMLVVIGMNIFLTSCGKGPIAKNCPECKEVKMLCRPPEQGFMSQFMFCRNLDTKEYYIVNASSGEPNDAHKIDFIMVEDIKDDETLAEIAYGNED